MPCLAHDFLVWGESRATISWPGGLNRVGGKAEGNTMETMPGREREVGFPGAKGVERELGLGG